MFGIGETYFIAYAIYLKATTVEIAYLSSIPVLLGSFVQIFSVWLTYRGISRKKLILIGASLQSVVWIPLAFLPQYFPDQGAWVLISLVILYYVAGNLIVPLWTDLMGDLVPAASRGRFFSRRTRLVSSTTFIAMVIGGIILHLFEESNIGNLGFVTLFMIAFCGRILSTFFLSKMQDPIPKRIVIENISTEKMMVPWFHFSQIVPHRQALIFSVFVALIQLSTFIAAPYFSVYMLKQLQLDYVLFMSLLATSVVSQFITLNFWGQLCDSAGNRVILVYTSILLPVMPLLWVVSNELWFLYGIQILGGAVWAGFTLSTNNTIFELVSPRQRPSFCAFHNIIANIGIAVGAMIGGWLASINIQTLNFGFYTAVLDNAFLSVFILSGILRIAVVTFLLKHIHDIPIAFPVSTLHYFRVVRLLPGFIVDWGFRKKNDNDGNDIVDSNINTKINNNVNNNVNNNIDPK